jgi:hypothetical protein
MNPYQKVIHPMGMPLSLLDLQTYNDWCDWAKTIAVRHAELPTALALKLLGPVAGR